MKKAALLLTIIVGTVNAHAIAPGKIQALKVGKTVYILDAYSKDYNLLRVVGLGGNNRQINFIQTRLAPADKKLTANLARLGKVIHNCGDDATPWNLNSTYIGANHGFYGVYNLKTAGQNFTAKDVGAALTDSGGNKIYIVKVFGPGHIWALGENKSSNKIWRISGKIVGKTLKTANGKAIKIESLKKTQLWPSCRIEYQKYLVNGKQPLPDGKVATCDFLDIKEQYDIIAPDSVLEQIKKHPGKKADFVAAGLDSVLTNKICYRFLPYGACTVRHSSTANRDFYLGYMGFIQSSQLNGKEQQYYIPKTIAFKNKKGRKFDFNSIENFSGKMPTNHFGPKYNNISDPNNLPDRFIQFLCENGKRKVGYAIGYSLIEGITQPAIRAKNSSSALFLYRSKKSYPSAVNSKTGKIKAGRTFNALAYRQYFNPELDKDATAIYFHPEGKSMTLYMHFHKNVKNKRIKLPENLVGKKISIIEKSPSFKVLTKTKVPTQGISVTVEKNPAYAVLKLD